LALTSWYVFLNPGTGVIVVICRFGAPSAHRFCLLHRAFHPSLVRLSCPEPLLLMFKLKKRSARALNAMQSYTGSVPSKATASAVMGNAGETPAEASGSVMNANVDDGAFNEPLVVDFASMHDGHTKAQSPPLTPPPSQHITREEQDSWYSDEDYDTGAAPAPAPPDFTRRGIHIPSRTR
jgi:hypothetical protein